MNRRILVGTFRGENFSWIKSRRLYNLPLAEGASLDSYKTVTHVVVMAEGFPSMGFEVKGVRETDGSGLKDLGYRLSRTPHARRYVLFSLGSRMPYGKLFADSSAEVFVSSTRFEGRIDVDFYRARLPSVGGRSMPDIFRKLRPYVKKWRSAIAFDPLQLDFLTVLFGTEKSPAPVSLTRQVAQEMTCLDFFAGSGLVSVALADYFKTVWANDISEKKAKVFNANNPPNILDVDSIENIRGKELPPVNLSWGSFPCQDLSLAGDMNGLYASRSGLFWQWLRVMDEMPQRPPVVVAENVIGLVSAADGSYYVTVHEELAKRGYHVGAVMLDAVHWVPQSRRRIFVVAVRKDIDISDFVTTGPIWCHPEPVCRVATKVKEWSWWKLPRPRKPRIRLSDIIEFDAPCDSASETKAKISLIPEQKINSVLMASQKSRQVFTGYRRTRNHRQVLEIRMDGIAGCLRTPCGGSSRQILVICDRGKLSTRLLTVRETARLMGAPDSFNLPGSYNDGYMAMGDGVAVPVASYLAEHLLAPLASKVTL